MVMAICNKKLWTGTDSFVQKSKEKWKRRKTPKDNDRQY